MGIVSCIHCVFNWHFFGLYSFCLVQLRPGKQSSYAYWALRVEGRPLPLASVYDHVKRVLAESSLRIFRYFMTFFFICQLKSFRERIWTYRYLNMDCYVTCVLYGTMVWRYVSSTKVVGYFGAVVNLTALPLKMF